MYLNTCELRKNHMNPKHIRPVYINGLHLLFILAQLNFIMPSLATVEIVPDADTLCWDSCVDFSVTVSCEFSPDTPPTVYANGHVVALTGTGPWRGQYCPYFNSDGGSVIITAAKVNCGSDSKTVTLLPAPCSKPTSVQGIQWECYHPLNPGVGYRCATDRKIENVIDTATCCADTSGEGCEPDCYLTEGLDPAVIQYSHLLTTCPQQFYTDNDWYTIIFGCPLCDVKQYVVGCMCSPDNTERLFPNPREHKMVPCS